MTINTVVFRATVTKANQRGIPVYIQTILTFINDAKGVWGNWITIFSWEKWKSLKGISTNALLHFEKFSEYAPN